MTARALYARLLIVAGLAFALTAGASAARTQGDDKTIFVSVLDATSGAPITDMTTADFAIREDGQDRQVVSARLSTQPLHIVMLADTSRDAEDYIHDIRTGFKSFIKDVLAKNPESQIAIWEFGQAAMQIKGFTSDPLALDKEAAKLFPKPRAPSVLLEALGETSEELSKRSGPRRAIVSLNIEPGDEQSRQEPKKVNASLMKSRAQLWALSVQKGTMKNAQRDVVLNTFIRNAGGLREYIVAQSAIEGYMRRYAAALTSQYELTYKRPSGRAQVVQTGAMRNNVKIITSIVPPQ
jgi:hypothetical protein